MSRRLLKKNKSRTSATQKANENAFVEKLDDLFDLAHENALTLMTIDEDRQFLLAQREKGRRGCMAGWDKQLHEIEKRVAERRTLADMRRQRKTELQERRSEIVTLELSSDDEANSPDSDSAEFLVKPPPLK